MRIACCCHSTDDPELHGIRVPSQFHCSSATEIKLGCELVLVPPGQQAGSPHLLWTCLSKTGWILWGPWCSLNLFSCRHFIFRRLVKQNKTTKHTHPKLVECASECNSRCSIFMAWDQVTYWTVSLSGCFYPSHWSSKRGKSVSWHGPGGGLFLRWHQPYRIIIPALTLLSFHKALKTWHSLLDLLMAIYKAWLLCFYFCFTLHLLLFLSTWLQTSQVCNLWDRHL